MYSGMDQSYDGFSSSQAIGGGGNFASPSQNTMNQYGAPSSQGGSSSGVKKRDPQSLVRVSIKQLNEATEMGSSKFAIDGRHAPQVCIVAHVLSVTPKETHVDLMVEDGSGTIGVKHFHDHGEMPAQDLKEGEYRCIIGQLRMIGGARCVTAFTLAPVEDHNIITMHMLDVILTHQRVTLGPAKAGGAMQGANGQMNGGGMGMGMGMGMNGVPGGYMKPEMNGHMSGNGHMVGQSVGVEMPPGMQSTGDPIRDQVLAAFATGIDAHTDGGCSVQSVVQTLSHLSVAQVHEAIGQLSSEGHLYSTIDEEHYKTTSAVM